ncbi:MAG: helix-turn-helix domain-containing protein [Planctomycetota bacterium]|nr:helix-turn-helix domain-containing protein [Planctomycetota bacterium]
MPASSLQRAWLDALSPGPLRHLFDHLPRTLFFAKDKQSRLMMGNPAFVRHCGFDREEQIIGLTDDCMFPPRLAAKYRADDRRVVQSRQPLLGMIELFPNADRKPEWFVTDKLPLFGRDGQCCGVCGTVRSYEEQHAAIQPYLELANVAEHLKHGFREPLDAERLARMAGLSVRQFQRKFRSTFQTTPRAYLMRMRIMHACGLLSRSRLPITAVALQSGFYDHSDFARQFQRHMGQPASAYRASGERRDRGSTGTLA